MNVADMTCAEVNERLARRRNGWQQNGAWMPCEQIGCDGTYFAKTRGKHALDYCHDWKWAGEVFQEMSCQQLYQCIDDMFGAGRCEPQSDMPFTEVIARAGLQMYLDADEQPT